MLTFALINPTPRNISPPHRLLYESEDMLNAAAHLRLLPVAFLCRNQVQIYNFFLILSLFVIRFNYYCLIINKI